MTELRQKMIRAMELKNLSPHTQRAYLAAVTGLAAKGAQLLTACVVGGGSVDFTGPGAALRKLFTVKRFGGRKILLFNHLGDLPCVRVTSPKPL